MNLRKLADPRPNTSCAAVRRLAIPPKMILRYVKREPRGSISCKYAAIRRRLSRIVLRSLSLSSLLFVMAGMSGPKGTPFLAQKTEPLYTHLALTLSLEGSFSALTLASRPAWAHRCLDEARLAGPRASLSWEVDFAIGFNLASAFSVPVFGRVCQRCHAAPFIGASFARYLTPRCIISGIPTQCWSAKQANHCGKGRRSGAL